MATFTTTVGEDGTWTIALPAETAGTHKIEVRQVKGADRSAPAKATLQATP